MPREVRVSCPSSRMLHAVESKACLGASGILRLTVLQEHNEKAIAFYEKRGYEHVADSDEGFIYEKVCAQSRRVYIG